MRHLVRSRVLTFMLNLLLRRVTQPGGQAAVARSRGGLVVACLSRLVYC